MAGISLLAFLLPPRGTSHAAEDDQIRAKVVEITHLIEELDRERAFTAIQQARLLSQDAPARAMLLLYEGILWCDMGNFISGQAAFHSALLLQPEASLPMPVAPKIKKQFEAARAAVVQQKAFMAAAEASAPVEKVSAAPEAALSERPPDPTPPPPAATPEPVEPDLGAERAVLLSRLEDLSVRLRRERSVLPLHAVQTLHAMKRQINAARDVKSLQAAAEALTAWESRYLERTPQQP